MACRRSTLAGSELLAVARANKPRAIGGRDATHNVDRGYKIELASTNNASAGSIYCIAIWKRRGASGRVKVW